MIDDKLLLVPEAAQHLRKSVKTIYRWVESGKIPFSKIGGSVGILESTVRNIMLNGLAVDDDSNSKPMSRRMVKKTGCKEYIWEKQLGKSLG